MDFLERLKKLMEGTHDNNASLARNSGVPYTTIDGLFKKGYKNAYVSTVQKLCDYFHVSLDYLVKGSTGISEDAQLLAGKIDALDATGRRMIELVLESEFTPAESTLLAHYRQLNPHGQQMALSMVESLTLNPEFKKDTRSAAV